MPKLIEKTLLDQIIKHMDSNQLYNHSMHGSIIGKSTLSALIEIQDYINQAYETKTESILLVLDQSLAYDIVQHQNLIKKIKVIGLDETAITLISSYLKNRNQLV